MRQNYGKKLCHSITMYRFEILEHIEYIQTFKKNNLSDFLETF